MEKARYQVLRVPREPQYASYIPVRMNSTEWYTYTPVAVDLTYEEAQALAAFMNTGEQDGS